jgi:hypothetical protein
MTRIYGLRMNTRYSLFRLLVLIVACSSDHALPTVRDAPANPLFREILTRVVERDDDTGAILTVQAIEGCSRHPHNLVFSIEQERDHTVVIVLHWNNKTNDGVYEKHRLVVDDAIRTELANQKKFQTKLEIIREAQTKERDKRFSQLTGGRLTYGMTQDEVLRTFGKPASVKPFAGARAAMPGTCDTWVYEDFGVKFNDGRAADIFRLDNK